MAKKAANVFKDALALSESERLKLIRLLSGTQGYDSPEIDVAWQAEIERREREIARDIEAGKSDWLPGPEAMAELAERYSQ
jgi:hypothetical protein